MYSWFAIRSFEFYQFEMYFLMTLLKLILLTIFISFGSQGESSENLYIQLGDFRHQTFLLKYILHVHCKVNVSKISSI